MQLLVVGVDERKREEDLGETKENVGRWSFSAVTGQLGDHYYNAQTTSKIPKYRREESKYSAEDYNLKSRKLITPSRSITPLPIYDKIFDDFDMFQAIINTY